ncbi:hypothetical protein D3C77_588200 [compost metagenome]
MRRRRSHLQIYIFSNMLQTAQREHLQQRQDPSCFLRFDCQDKADAGNSLHQAASRTPVRSVEHNP